MKLALVAGHPIWHFALVAGAGVVTLVVVKTREWWKDHGLRLGRPSLALVAMSVLGAGSAIIHAMVCGEHFHEWVLYGVFFLCASTLQSAWSILILLRPNRSLLLLGAVGNALVVITFAFSRTTGMPFGPDPFHPEVLDTLGLVATSREIGLVALATRVLLATRHNPEGSLALLGSLHSRS
jgi:hypothetical protein